MGVVVRQSIKTVVISFGGAILGAGFTAAMLAVLSPSEMGSNRNLVNQAIILQVVLLLGIGSAVNVFIQRYNAEDERRKVLLTSAFLVPLAALLILAGPYCLAREWVVNRFQPDDREAVSRYYLWMPVLALLWSYITLLELYLLANFRAAASAFGREILLRFLTLAIIGCVWLEWISFHQFMVTFVAIHGVVILYLLWRCKYIIGFGWSGNWSLFTKREWREVAHFSWYHMLMSLAANLALYLDSLFLAPLSKGGLADLAVYNLALFIVSLMVIPYRAFSAAAFPAINEAYIGNRRTDLQQLYQRSSQNIVAAGLGVLLPVLAVLPTLTGQLQTKYSSLVPLVLILSVGRLGEMTTGLNNEIINVSRSYKLNFRLSIVFLVLAVIFNRLTIPIYGMWGAATVSSCVLIVSNCVKGIILWKKYKLTPLTPSFAKLLLIACLAGGVSFLIPSLSHWLFDASIRAFVTVIIYTAGLVLFKAVPDASALLQTVLRRIHLKKEKPA